MTVFFDIFLIVFLFFIFGFLHSYLASFKFKKRIIEKFGSLIAFYRLFYNIAALFLFFLIIKISPEPDIVIYDLNFPFDITILVFQFISLLGLIWTLSYVDLKEFLGVNQIIRWRKGNYNISELDETTRLRIHGPYKISRHPLYLFTILFLTFRPAMSLTYFVFLICFILYFYIGSYYEEKKLIDRFGVEYSEYQKRVPRIFPLFK